MQRAEGNGGWRRAPLARGPLIAIDHLVQGVYLSAAAKQVRVDRRPVRLVYPEASRTQSGFATAERRRDCRRGPSALWCRPRHKSDGRAQPDRHADGLPGASNHGAADPFGLGPAALEWPFDVRRRVELHKDLGWEADFDRTRRQPGHRQRRSSVLGRLTSDHLVVWQTPRPPLQCDLVGDGAQQGGGTADGALVCPPKREEEVVVVSSQGGGV